MKNNNTPTTEEKILYAICGPDGGYWHGYNGVSKNDSYSELSRNSNPTLWDDEDDAIEEIERAKEACKEWNWFDGIDTNFSLEKHEL